MLTITLLLSLYYIKMKKFYLLVASLMMAGAAMAQSNVKYSVKAGVNIANLNVKAEAMGFSESDNANSITGFYVGGAITAPIGQKFSFQPELLASLQGFKETDGDAKLNNWYINVPLMLKYNIIDGLSAEAGPQVGFLISSKVKEDGYSVDAKDNFKTLDLGINFGAEYEFKGGVFVNARYNLGLANIGNTGGPIETEFGDINVKMRNRVFSFGLGYRF